MNNQLYFVNGSSKKAHFYIKKRIRKNIWKSKGRLAAFKDFSLENLFQRGIQKVFFGTNQINN